MRIWFDRHLAKGRFKFAILIALAILFVPFAASLIHGAIQEILCSGRLFGSHTERVLEAYETYLNPSFDECAANQERGYKILIAYIGAFLLNGLLVSLVVSWIQNRRERWEKGDLRYRKFDLGTFCIVIGGNEMAPDLVGQLLKDKKQPLSHVLVMTNRDVAALRKKFESKLSEKEEKKVVIYYGERTSKEDVEKLKPQYAKEIYVIGEQLDIEQTGSHHDVKNMECVRILADYLGKDKCLKDKIDGYNVRKEIAERTSDDSFCEEDPRKICRVMFEYQSTFSVFQFADVSTEISSVMDFKPFNYYETWAQKVLVCKEIDLKDNTPDYLPLEGKMPITADSEDFAHLIVVGMSRMGMAMAVEAAHIGHYPNFISKGKQTRITFIDSQARKEMRFFQGHYKELFAVSRWRYMEASGDMRERKLEKFSWIDPRKDEEDSPYKDNCDYTLGEQLTDVEWQFIQGDLEMPSVQNFIREAAREEHARLTIAICFPKDNASLAASLYLPDDVYDVNSNVVQVLAYQPYGDAMQKSFRNDMADWHKSYKMFAKLKAFGMMDGCFSIAEQQQMKTVTDAFDTEYKHASASQIPGRNKLREKMGMQVLKAGKTVAAKLWSNFYSASHLWTKLRSVEYDGEKLQLEEDDERILAAVEHIRWNMEQLLMGYAPLNAKEYRELMEKRKDGQAIKYPEKELHALTTVKGNELNADSYPHVKKWLERWKGFDDMKEQKKADMTHADISSLEVLRKIDEDAIAYDEVLVKVLPKVYQEIKQK